jgi:acetyltransferase
MAVRGRALTTADGTRLRLRPVQPDDAPALQRGFARLTPEQVRQRTFHRMNELSAEAAHRLANIDPATTAAYVVVDDPGENHRAARQHVEGDEGAAELALVVDPQKLGVGIGTALMRRLFEEARLRGLREMWGTVLAQNALMLELAHRLGAQREAVAGEPDVVRVRFDLRKPRRNQKRT